MADSIRLQILTAIQDVLASVPGIGDTGGPKKSLLSINRYPAAFVQPGDDTVTQEVNTLLTREMNVDIVIAERSETDVLRAIETILPKVQKQLAENHTLGGLCIDLGEPEGGIGISAPFPLIEGQPDVAVHVGYRCLYRVRRDDPYLVG
jgi:hypothetical protein